MKSLVIGVCLSLAGLLSGCAGSPAGSDRGVEAVLKPTQGNQASGMVAFRQAGDAVVVTAKVTGLTPGAHGFHIHEKGDCSAPDATSAGGHFNPTGKPHGHPEQGDHHAGDMLPLVADASGVAELTARLPGLATASDAPDSLVGRAVIVHAAADDFKTQPTGNSGGRVACGVIARP